MFKLLIILILLFLIGGLVYWRIRPYLQIAKKAIGVIRDVRQGTFTPGVGTKRETVTTPQKLVQCTGCGTWVPVRTAVSASGEVFCSVECVNRRVN